MGLEKHVNDTNIIVFINDNLIYIIIFNVHHGLF
jgi:hypothetical protein